MVSIRRGRYWSHCRQVTHCEGVGSGEIKKIGTSTDKKIPQFHKPMERSEKRVAQLFERLNVMECQPHWDIIV